METFNYSKSLTGFYFANSGVGFGSFRKYVFGNAGTLAMDQEKDRSGSAAALIGSSELLAGSIGIFVIGLFEAETLYPLSLMIIGCSFFCVLLIVKSATLRKQLTPSPE